MINTWQLYQKIKGKKKDPQTPDKYQLCSKRSWDGQISRWRRLLHEYDPPQSSEDIIVIPQLIHSTSSQSSQDSEYSPLVSAMSTEDSSDLVDVFGDLKAIIVEPLPVSADKEPTPQQQVHNVTTHKENIGPTKTPLARGPITIRFNSHLKANRALNFNQKTELDEDETLVY